MNNLPFPRTARSLFAWCALDARCTKLTMMILRFIGNNRHYYQRYKQHYKQTITMMRYCSLCRLNWNCGKASCLDDELRKWKKATTTHTLATDENTEKGRRRRSKKSIFTGIETMMMATTMTKTLLWILDGTVNDLPLRCTHGFSVCDWHSTRPSRWKAFSAKNSIFRQRIFFSLFSILFTNRAVLIHSVKYH